MEKVQKVVPCDRCGGLGALEQWRYTGLTCYKCGGSGKMTITEVIHTPEEQAKLEARRAKAQAKRQAEWEAKQQEREEAELRRQQREAEREAARVARLRKGFVGQPGERVTLHVAASFLGSYERPAYASYGTEVVRVYGFETDDRKLLIWKTSSALLDGFALGQTYRLTGTVKEHTTYNDEDQTQLLRVKLQEVAP